jgi:hypothetical protein
MKTRKNSRTAIYDTAARDGAGVIGRRTLFKGAAGLAVALGTLELAGRHAVVPQRMTLDASTLPDIQFDIGAYISAPQSFSDGAGTVTAQMPPVHSAALSRTPTRRT